MILALECIGAVSGIGAVGLFVFVLYVNSLSIKYKDGEDE